MTTSKNHVFVLWGEGFEEVSGAIFVTELRQAGLMVKVVGLNAQRLNGVGGLALVPDLTLSQALALAGQTICVIIPYALSDFEFFLNDPRLLELFRQTCDNRAKFVTSRSTKITLMNLEFLPVASVAIYSSREGLISFTQTLADSLFVMIQMSRREKGSARQQMDAG